MSIRYGQKVAGLADKQISSAFNSFNRKITPKVPSIKNTSRASDFISIPSISSDEQKVALLVFVSDSPSNFLAFTCAGNYTVDWGDGVTENVATGVAAQHLYDYSTFDPTNSTLNSEGFKQALVIITPQAGANLTSLNFQTKHTSALAANVYSQQIIEMYISAPNLTSITLGTNVLASVYPRSVRYVNLINSGSVTNFTRLFGNMHNLVKADIGVIGAVTTFTEMFTGCSSLVEVNFLNPSSTTSLNNTSYMFYNCYSLLRAPFFNTAAVTAMNHKFYGCYSLNNVPLYNTANVTTMSNMFLNCYSLTTVPLFDTIKVTTMSQMFYVCYSLQTVPLFNTVAVTDMSYMFFSCYDLTSIPLFNTSKVTTMVQMFYNCYSLASLPLLNTGSVTNMNAVFYSCRTLATIPLFNTSNVTNMANMFSYCDSLQSIPLLNTSKVTNMYQMFYNCYSLKQVPLIDVSKITTTGAQYMFSNCSSLVSLPDFNYSLITDMQYMFSSCTNLIKTPSFDANNITAFTGSFDTNYSLSIFNITNIKYTVSLTNCKLSRTQLETFFANLGTAAAGATRTLNCTNNWGVGTVSSIVSTTTAGSTTVTMTNTGSLSVGMQVIGTNTAITTGRAVTFTDAGDLVNLTAHGLSDGDEVSFSVITTTTGIVINTIYFVVNQTTDNFQLAATAGGPALPLTSNGSGTIRYNSTIVSIVPNTSVTMSRPMAASGSTTLSFRLLQTYKALLKGFTVSV